MMPFHCPKCRDLPCRCSQLTSVESRLLAIINPLELRVVAVEQLVARLERRVAWLSIKLAAGADSQPAKTDQR